MHPFPRCKSAGPRGRCVARAKRSFQFAEVVHVVGAGFGREVLEKALKAFDLREYRENRRLEGFGEGCAYNLVAKGVGDQCVGRLCINLFEVEHHFVSFYEDTYYIFVLRIQSMFSS